MHCIQEKAIFRLGTHASFSLPYDSEVACASVELDEFGAQVEVSVSDTDSFFEEIRGGAGSLSASFNTFSSIVVAGDPQVFIESELTDSGEGIALPILRGAVNGGADEFSFVTATGIAVQGFTFTGEAEQTFFIDVELTGTAEGNAFVQAELLFAQVGESFFVFDPVTDVIDRFSSFGGSNTPVFLGIDENSPDLQTGVAQITVQPGDSFYLVGLLELTARQGGSIDTADTFTTAFQPTPALADLVVASAGTAPAADSTVPEPVSLLVWTGLAGVFGVQARLRKRA